MKRIKTGALDRTRKIEAPVTDSPGRAYKVGAAEGGRALADSRNRAPEIITFKSVTIYFERIKRGALSRPRKFEAPVTDSLGRTRKTEEKQEEGLGRTCKIGGAEGGC